MTEFIIKENPEEEEDYGCPDPREKSTIIFQVEYVDGNEFGIMDCDSIGGAAAYEQEYGIGLDYVIKELVDPTEVELIEDGWYIIEEFEMYFSKDYYGEVDCDYYCGKIRKATEEDKKGFWGEP